MQSRWNLRRYNGQALVFASRLSSNRPDAEGKYQRERPNINVILAQLPGQETAVAEDILAKYPTS